MPKINYHALHVVYSDYENDSAFAHLRSPGTRLIEGEGDRPTVFILGGAPSAQESVSRRAFVSPAGILLRRLMDVAGLYAGDHELDGRQVKANSWLTYTVKYRPLGGREPNLGEIKASRPYLKREWRAVGMPSVMVSVGTVAHRAITGEGYLGVSVGTPIQASHGTVWPMYRPEFGLRNLDMRPTMEQHWRDLGKWLDDRYLRRNSA